MLVCGLLAAVSVPALAQDHPVLAAEHALIAAAATDGAASALRAAFAADAVFLWPGAPVAVGADAGRLAAAQPFLDSLRLTLRPLLVQLARDSSLGVAWGMAFGVPGARGALHVGRYIGVWRREGGRWRLAAFLLGAMVAPQATVLPPAMPLQRPPLAPAGAAAPFVAADIAFARLAADSGAAIAFTRWAAPDVMMFGAGGMLARGPAEVGRYVDGPAAWWWTPVAAGASGSGDLGWTVGESVITPEGGAASYGKYLTVWVRLPDGTVRYTHDGGTPRPAP
jgi:ketosteroid isomerase-like protein